MPRIRSIHPGLWTDEAFAGLSDAASLLAIGLWNEADDNGIFEWKPLTLKMRLRPGKSESLTDITALLAELAVANLIQSFEVDGRRYGAVKNFAKWQRPKTPTAVHPLPETMWSYTGRTPEGDRPRSGTGRPPGTQASRNSEVVPNEFGRGSEVGCQREEEGGRRKDVEGKREKEETAIAVNDNDRDASGTETTTGETPDTDQPVAASSHRHRPAEDYFINQPDGFRVLNTDVARWQSAFPNLNVAGELLNASGWAIEKLGKNWFHPLQSWMNKKDAAAKAEATARKAKAEVEATSGRPQVNSRYRL